MDSEDEDPFCYRSLKRIKTNHERTPQRTQQIHHDVGGKTDAKKFELKSFKKQSKKTKKYHGAKQETTRSNSKTDMAVSHSSKEPVHNGHNANYHKNKELKETRIKGAECRQSTPTASLYEAIPSSNNSTTNNGTEEYSQSSCLDKNRSIEIHIGEADYSSDACLEQKSEHTMQTGLCFSEVPSKLSDLHDKNGSHVVEVMQPHREAMPKDSNKEGRCPFCQMPFQALHGQSLNWHTMECMDVPLKTAQECPAGLRCDSTVASHYRRYSHSQLALHLAGQGQEGDRSRGGSETHSNADQVTRSPVPPRHDSGTEARAALPEEKRKSKKTSKLGKRKQPPSASKKGQSTAASSLSPTNSQGSQNSTGSNSSIKAYFSPGGKKNAASRNAGHCESSQDRESEIMSDPVFRLLISDSDSDESADNNRKEETLQSEILKDEGKHQPQCPGEIKHASENPCESENAVSAMEDIGSGFIRHEPDDPEPCADSADAEQTLTESTVHSDLGTEVGETSPSPSDTEAEMQQSARVSHSVSPATSRTSTAPFAVQKQTSLFSFFKPHCHQASIANQAPKGAAAAATSKLSITPVGPERGGGSKQAGRRALLRKSASEPVKLMRVPSPPQNDAVRARDRQRMSGASQSPLSNGTSSFKNSSGRQCPFYKRLPGTAITVDAFYYGVIPGCQAYVLTHFHYDHYQGLTKHFSQPMYCSPVTGNLVEKQINVHSKWINRLPLNQPCQVAGVWLTLMEANHCPGAVIILFELPNGKRLLHTGDFRADPCMEQYPPLVGISVDELYLDTTYCDPAYAFPSQREAIQFAVSTAQKTLEREPSTLIVCGAYTIGKERIFIALAEALQTKICVQPAKKRVLDCLEDPRLKDMVSLKWTDGCVHVLPMRQLNSKGLDQHLGECRQFSSVLAFEPTGWTHSNKTLSLDSLRPKFSSRRITVYGVPYSEHSSYLEMKRFVQFLRPKKILPTVNNGNANSRKKMEAIFRQWMSERTPQVNQGLAKNTTQPSLGAWLGKRS